MSVYVHPTNVLFSGDVDSGGGCACVGIRGKWEICVSSFQFCYKPETALKLSPLIKKKDK